MQDLFLYLSPLHFLIVAAMLFSLGIVGIILNRRNIVVILMSTELILLAVNLNFITFSQARADLTGHIFTIFNMTIAAAEAAIGLAILVAYFRNRQTILVDDVSQMHS